MSFNEAAQQIRENGSGVNIWLSNGVLGNVVVNYTDCSIYRAR